MSMSYLKISYILLVEMYSLIVGVTLYIILLTRTSHLTGNTKVGGNHTNRLSTLKKSVPDLVFFPQI